ncbi:MAG: type II toxin-antitoxin system VapC family toxin [Polaromonas sp.]
MLDTNFIIGLLKSQPDVIAEVSSRNISSAECAYSAVTRMEILGFHGISSAENLLIRSKLEKLTYIPLTRVIEDLAINLRIARKMKLPDAVIGATAMYLHLELLTLDRHLQSVVQTAQASVHNYP